MHLMYVRDQPRAVACHLSKESARSLILIMMAKIACKYIEDFSGRRQAYKLMPLHSTIQDY